MLKTLKYSSKSFTLEILYKSKQSVQFPAHD